MNLKTSILSLLMFCMLSSVCAQKSGVIYRSFSDFVSDKADTTNNMLVEARTRSQIYMSGGNDFKVYSEDKALSKSLKKEVWAVKSNDSLFLNCAFHQLGLWYAFAERINDKLYFSAAISFDKEIREQLAIAGAIGGPVAGGLASGSLALKRFYYVMNLDSGKMEYLSKDSMSELLQPFTDLLERYRNEKTPEDVETIKLYLTEFRNKK
jgi:hypothetical protein